MSLAFPLIEIEGPPFERGVQYGQKARDRIHKSVEFYMNLMADYGCPWDKTIQLAGDFVEQIASHDKRFLDEIRGIAEGSGEQLEAVIVVNGRSELMFGHDWKDLQTDSSVQLDGDCTSVLAMPESTRNNRLIHSQNWDWRQECIESAIVLRVIPESGPTILTFVEAGGLARCGLNSMGIAITANGLDSDLDFDRTGVPLSIIRRQVLQSCNLHDALDAVINTPRAVSNNMVLSSVEALGAEAINMETSPDDVFWIYPENGLIIHANHFESPVARIKLKDTGLSESICSLYRSSRARSLLRPKIGDITLADVKATLLDKFGSPQAICRSPVRSRRGNYSMTVASIIMDTQVGKMFVCPSPHNCSDFTEYDLEPGREPIRATI